MYPVIPANMPLHPSGRLISQHGLTLRLSLLALFDFEARNVRVQWRQKVLLTPLKTTAKWKQRALDKFLLALWFVEQTGILERMFCFFFPHLRFAQVKPLLPVHTGWKAENPRTGAANALSWKGLIHLVCWPWKSQTSSWVHHNFPTVSKASCWGFIAAGVIDTEPPGAATHNGVTLKVTDDQMKTERRLRTTAAEWKLWRILNCLI